MSTKHKKKHRRRTAPSANHRPAAGTFRMVVAANPGAELTVAPELDLVKAAPLYGDSVGDDRCGLALPGWARAGRVPVVDCSHD